ncbi:hypothetical protein ULF88_20365 [Halopseudomonas pachastrellae]|nr:hypothetical protein [Halopseudomonas pachastrellae]
MAPDWLVPARVLLCRCGAVELLGQVLPAITLVVVDGRRALANRSMLLRSALRSGSWLAASSGCSASLPCSQLRRPGARAGVVAGCWPSDG